MRDHHNLRPQDVVVLLKLTLWGDQPWQSKEVAKALHLSATEISFALKRCEYARLLDGTRRQIARRTLLDFLVYGLPVVYPTQPGAYVRGMPTGHSAPPMNQHLSTDQLYVWPDAESECWGSAIEPLYPKLPQAAREDESLYELVALTDSLRVGRPREKKLAGELLTQRLLPSSYA